MAEELNLVKDLAIILIAAGFFTLVSKALKQPLILGYIIAGFVVGPKLGLFHLASAEAVHEWSEIGIIFLLFALGLEFSFKKLLKVGSGAMLMAGIKCLGMFVIGILLGELMGWSLMEGIFLGGLMGMSSTTIIIKAYDDMGLKNKPYAPLIFGSLVVEDLIAVLLMVLLSTLAVSGKFGGAKMALALGKLVFFLVLWFLVGIYVIPTILKKARKLLNDETLLILAIGLCFTMVIIADSVGFSSALGAFVMGSILAETLEGERIEHLLTHIKNLFGAIFFVSVGMMVDPAMIAQHALPILVITLTVIIGQLLFATLGVLLSGQPLKTAMQCGFSLTQIGEFAFIIATLGVALGVTSDFLYPIVVAVSVITIFLTPYMIRLAEPSYGFVYKHLPARAKAFLDNYTVHSPSTSKQSLWKDYIVAIVRNTVIHGIICIAICALGFSLLVPFTEKWLPSIWAHILSGSIIILMMAPFLRAIMIKKNRSKEYLTLWEESRSNRAPLVASIVVRIGIALGFVLYVLGRLFHISIAWLFLLAFALVTYIIFSRYNKRRSHQIEATFRQNLRSREPEYASRLLSKDLHLAVFDIPANIPWAGESLSELRLGKRFGIHVVSILRGGVRINIPKGEDRICPQDRLQAVGSDSQLEAFGRFLQEEGSVSPTGSDEEGEMQLRCIPVSPHSPFQGKTLPESGLRDKWHCMLVGVEKADGNLHTPNVAIPFEDGDILWLVGEASDLKQVESV